MSILNQGGSKDRSDKTRGVLEKGHGEGGTHSLLRILGFKT